MGKIKLNKDGLKGLFINHVEKMVLGVVLLVFGVFVYSSLGLEGLPSGETPDALIQSAQNAEKRILDPANAQAVLATVTISSDDYVERAKLGLMPTDSPLYFLSKPPTPSWRQDGSKREDPKLLPPEKPEVHAITGAVAVMMKSVDDDLLFKEKNSVAAPPKVVKTPKKAPRGYGGMSGMSGMDGGAGLGEDSGMGMSGMPGGMSGMPGAMGMPGGMDGMPGADGTTGGILANPQDRIGFMAGQGAVAKSQNCIAVKFLVPWRKQWEEFDAKFSPSLGFNPARDTPNYLSFTAERLEVGDDPQAPQDWSKAVKIAWTSKTKDEMLNAGFYGFAPEIADPRYLYIGFLTFPVPPYINRNLEPLALHKEVPKISPNMMTMPGETGVDKDGKKKDTKKKSDESDAPVDAPGTFQEGADGSGMAGMPGGMMGGGMMGGGMMSGGMGSGMMSGGTGSGMMSGGMGSGMMPGGMGSGMMPGEGAGMPGMMGMGSADGMGASDGGMGSGGYGMGMGETAIVPGPPVPYLLIRFYDFTAETGKKYRYRVQTLLEDPNHPKFAQLEPSDRFLDEEVKKRLAEVVSAEKTDKKRYYYLRTDWSEPSEPISVELKSRSLAGTVLPVKLGAAPELNSGVKEKMITDEPEGKVMSVMWDDQFATDVVGITNVFRGTFLNFTATGDAIHPIMLVFKSLEKYDFYTDRLVADIRGGEELPGGDKDAALLTPGQFALIDDNGQIIVHNEMDDWDDFRKLALPEITAPTMDAGSMMGEEGLDGGGSPDGAMPGASKKGRARKGAP